MNAVIGGMITPIKIDISTGDVITPREVRYDYSLLIEDRKINLWAYNLETILAEKIQTILSRSTLNTRMRDFYDVYVLTEVYGHRIDENVFHAAFIATARKRNSEFVDCNAQLKRIAANDAIQSLWMNYRKKYTYAKDICFENVIESVNALIQKF